MVFLRKKIVGSFAVDDYAFDPSINNLPASGFNLDLDVGISYRIKEKLYLGLGITNLIANEMLIESSSSSSQESFSYRVARNYNLQAGYTLPLNTSLELEPNLLITSDGQTNQIQLNSIVIYKEKFGVESLLISKVIYPQWQV